MTQNALPLELDESDTEASLIRRLGEHGAQVFVMDVTGQARIQRYRSAILGGGLDCVIVGRAPNGKPETYAQLFERHFGEPLQLKRKGKSHDQT
jgi:hypothetical protein